MEKIVLDKLICLERGADIRVETENSIEEAAIMENSSESPLNENNANMLMNEREVAKIETEKPFKRQKTTLKLKKKILMKRNPIDESIKKLTKFDLKCKIELHKLQIEVEKKRLRNIEREYDLIEAKIKYYKTKSLLNMIL